MPKKKYSFKLKSSLSELDRLCEHLDNFGQSQGLSKKCIFEINLALDELFTNIISYGFADDDEHVIEVTLTPQRKTLCLCIKDDAFRLQKQALEARAFSRIAWANLSAVIDYPVPWDIGSMRQVAQCIPHRPCGMGVSEQRRHLPVCHHFARWNLTRQRIDALIKVFCCGLVSTLVHPVPYLNFFTTTAKIRPVVWRECYRFFLLNRCVIYDRHARWLPSARLV